MATQHFIDWAPWVISFVAIYSKWATGNKNKNGWLASGVNQTLWFIWICLTKNWGLLPLSIVTSVLVVRNYLKWKREEV